MVKKEKKVTLGKVRTKGLGAHLLNSLISRPYLRYTLTKRGQKVLERGTEDYTDLPHNVENLLDSLIEAVQANNKQPISLITWKKFHAPKKVTNNELKGLVTFGIVKVLSRGKYSSAKGAS